MKPRYLTDFDFIMDMAIGKKFYWTGLNGRQLSDLGGDLAYFFQGTIKVNDDRLNDPLFLLTPETDWRIVDTFQRNEEFRNLWDVTITKVELPDHWNADLIAARKDAAKRK